MITLEQVLSMKKYIFISLLIFLIVYLFFFSSSAKTYPPGILVADEPQQTSLPVSLSWEHKGYQITALSSFTIEARVLSKERYFFGRESELSPVDLALGWGVMSDQRMLDKVDISQGNRWYYWHSRELPVGANIISSHSANMHMISSNEEIEKLLKSVDKGDVIELSGYLVSVKADDGWRWRSSLSRKDTGDGSCEVVWVQNFSIRES